MIFRHSDLPDPANQVKKLNRQSNDDEHGRALEQPPPLDLILSGSPALSRNISGILEEYPRYRIFHGEIFEQVVFERLQRAAYLLHRIRRADNFLQWSS